MSQFLAYSTKSRTLSPLLIALAFCTLNATDASTASVSDNLSLYIGGSIVLDNASGNREVLILQGDYVRILQSPTSPSEKLEVQVLGPESLTDAQGTKTIFVAPSLLVPVSQFKPFTGSRISSVQVTCEKDRGLLVRITPDGRGTVEVTPTDGTAKYRWTARVLAYGSHVLFVSTGGKKLFLSAHLNDYSDFFTSIGRSHGSDEGEECEFTLLS